MYSPSTNNSKTDRRGLRSSVDRSVKGTGANLLVVGVRALYWAPPTGHRREFLRANRFQSESRVGKLNRFKAV